MTAPNIPPSPAHPTSRAAPSADAGPQPDPGGPPLSWHSRELLGNAREAVIHHEGSTYRLRLTSLGKLILTK